MMTLAGAYANMYRVYTQKMLIHFVLAHATHLRACVTATA